MKFGGTFNFKKFILTFIAVFSVHVVCIVGMVNFISVEIPALMQSKFFLSSVFISLFVAFVSNWYSMLSAQSRRKAACWTLLFLLCVAITIAVFFYKKSVKEQYGIIDGWDMIGFLFFWFFIFLEFCVAAAACLINLITD